MAESFGPAFCTESGSFFSIWQSCICSSWLGNSASRLGGSLEPGKVQDIEDAFRLSDLPFHYHRLSLALPNICICSTCWKKTSLIGTVYECWFPLDFPVLHWLWALERAYHCNLRCFLSHSWNLHSLVTMQVGKGQIRKYFLPKAARFLFWAWKSSVNRLDNPKSQWNFRRLVSLLFHCFSLYSL